jgi:hypothetical protein
MSALTALTALTTLTTLTILAATVTTTAAARSDGPSDKSAVRHGISFSYGARATER